MRNVILCLSVFVLSAQTFANVSLSHVFSDHMVLQREMPIRVSGFAAAGEKVAVTLDKNTADAVADADGAWQVTLPAMPAGGPFEMVIIGKNTVKVRDILVGEVWVCSGQSNMEWWMGNSTTGAADLPAANNPQIRLLNVYQKVYLQGDTAPQKDIIGSWALCTPGSVREFSGVGYYFGKRLQAELHVPVGLINSSVGGSRIEPWTPREALLADPHFVELVHRLDAADQKYRAELPARIQQIEAWLPVAKKALADKAPVPPLAPLYANPATTDAMCLYNEKIAALTTLAIRGAIWYQGESNSDEGMLYTLRMKALISGWRKAWCEPDMPFYFVQLAPFIYPNHDQLPYLWEAQTAALEIPHTGMAVISDLVTDLNDIHPKDKLDVGNRLALIALAKTYGRNELVCSGPMYKSVAVEGDRVRLEFNGVAGGLASRDGKPLTWFTIAGEDRKFVPAQAAIDGNSVVVWAPGLAKPVAVRFGWSESAQPNLMNKEGLPASPFRTDRW